VSRNQLQTRQISNRLPENLVLEKKSYKAVDTSSLDFSYHRIHKRADLIEYLLSIIDDQDVLVATTGYTSRELNTIGDRNLNFYTVGAMGCASSIALGISIVSKQRVIILDGDGAGLMRMSALSTIGFVNPPNLVHIMLDNGLHESTGSQPTASSSTAFWQVASSCGYTNAVITNNLKDLEDLLSQKTVGSTFIHFVIKPGTLKDLGRPTISPEENTIRLRESINKN
jgi:phosphonopyruvate decarboxylase